MRTPKTLLQMAGADASPASLTELAHRFAIVATVDQIPGK